MSIAKKNTYKDVIPYTISNIDLLIESADKFHKIYECLVYDNINEALLHCGYMEAKIKSYLIDIGEYVKKE